MTILDAALVEYRQALVTQLRRDMWLLFGPPKRVPFPHIVLLPRVQRVVDTATTVRHRVADALDVLMHGMPECDR